MSPYPVHISALDTWRQTNKHQHSHYMHTLSTEENIRLLLTGETCEDLGDREWSTNQYSPRHGLKERLRVERSEPLCPPCHPVWRSLTSTMAADPLAWNRSPLVGNKGYLDPWCPEHGPRPEASALEFEKHCSRLYHFHPKDLPYGALETCFPITLSMPTAWIQILGP